MGELPAELEIAKAAGIASGLSPDRPLQNSYPTPRSRILGTDFPPPSSLRLRSRQAGKEALRDSGRWDIVLALAHVGWNDNESIFSLSMVCPVAPGPLAA